MGAVDYDVLHIGKATAREAFSVERENARDSFGHQEGYSGDIQTADGFAMIQDRPRLGTKKFTDFVSKRQENMSKGDCCCIELTKHEVNKYKSHRCRGKKGVKGYFFFGVGRC